MKLKPYGNIVKCNHCNECFIVYTDIFRCFWCSYYNFVKLSKTEGKFIYPPTLLGIDIIIRLPYYEPDNIRSKMHDPKYDSAFVPIEESAYQKRATEGVE